METRLSSLLTLIILFSLPFSLKAQEYREASHACFDLEEERIIRLDGGNFISKKEWSDKQVFASIPPLPVPCSFIFNGFPFGIIENGKTGSTEFNITPFLKNENNMLKLVPEDSSASQFPLPDCSLLIRENILISDMIVSEFPGLTKDERLVRVQLFIKSFLSKAYLERKIDLDLRDPLGKSLTRESRALSTALSFGQKTEMHFDLVLENPFPWLPVTRNLYEIVLSMKEEGGQNPELISKQFAFINFWHNDSLLVQNGDTLLLKYASENQAKILTSMNEKQGKDLIIETGINAIRVNTPLSCQQEAFLKRCGILVVTD